MIGDIIFLSNFLSSNCKVLGGASSTPRLLLLHRLQLLQTFTSRRRGRMHNRTKTAPLAQVATSSDFLHHHTLKNSHSNQDGSHLAQKLVQFPQTSTTSRRHGRMHNNTKADHHQHPRLLSAHPADRFFLLRISDFQSRNKITWIQKYMFDILT